MVDETIRISQEEYEARSKENVERWISAHVIPVCIHCPRNKKALLIGPQQSPITFSPTSQFETMQPGCVITVTSAVPEKEFNPEKPSWQQVVLNGNVSIISRHEVRRIMALLQQFTDRTGSYVSQASNGVLYLIDGVICE